MIGFVAVLVVFTVLRNTGDGRLAGALIGRTASAGREVEARLPVATRIR